MHACVLTVGVDLQQANLPVFKDQGFRKDHSKKCRLLNAAKCSDKGKLSTWFEAV
jgi:hypothetical protein